MNDLIEGGNFCLTENSNSLDPLYIRLLRKKYKCVLLWFFSIICVSQLFYIIIDKIDNKILENFINRSLDNSNFSTFCNSTTY